MELSFVSPEIRDLCLNVQTAIDAIGEHDFSVLKQRLADLDAVNNAAEYMDLFQDDVSVSEDGSELYIKLSTMVLIVAQAHTNLPVAATGQIDWSRVKRVKIVSLERIDD
ncbi:hypothetical protein [Lacisediminimonas profundi]|uniref:hypothetical protein n=1 Tax=Lacisediminimonas profundi TaxID=2603856 RepID=UPI00124B9E65|nr:hypothetical protein [Lacisediminimonas profundi]